MVADDVYMYVRMCLRIYVCMRYARACKLTAWQCPPACPSNVRHKRFSSVRHCVRRVTGGCYRFWQEKDDGEKEEKQEREEARMKIIIIT